MSARSKRKVKVQYSEQLAAAKELSPNPENDALLMKLAHDMCRPESLAKYWTVEYDAVKEQRCYRNTLTGETQNTHPLLAYYRGAIFMERGGYQRLLEADDASPPSNEEIYSMAEYLGIRSEEHPYVVEVARMAISAALPPEWIEVIDREDCVSYRNTETKEVSKMHPLDAYFVELRNRRRKEARSKRSTRTLSISESPRDVNEQDETLKALEEAARARPRRKCEDRPTEVLEDDNKENGVLEPEVAEQKITTVLEWYNSDKAQDGGALWEISEDTIRFLNDSAGVLHGFSERDKNSLVHGVSFDHTVEALGPWEDLNCKELVQQWDASLKRDHKISHPGCMMVSVKAPCALTSTHFFTKLRLLVECIGVKATNDISAQIAVLAASNTNLMNLVQPEEVTSTGERCCSDQTFLKWKKLKNIDELKLLLESLNSTISEETNSNDVFAILEFCQSGTPAFRVSALELVDCTNQDDWSPLSIEIALMNLKDFRNSKSRQTPATWFEDCSLQDSPRTRLLKMVEESLMMQVPMITFSLICEVAMETETSLIDRLISGAKLFHIIQTQTSNNKAQLVECLTLALCRLHRVKLSKTHRLNELQKQLRVIQDRVEDVLKVFEVQTETQEDVRTIEGSILGLDALAQLKAEHLKTMEEVRLEAQYLGKRVEELEIENAELEARITSLNTKALEQEDNAKERNNNVQKLLEEITKLKMQGQEKDTHLGSYEIELSRLRIECEKINGMTQKITFYEEQISTLTDQLMKLNQEKANCEERFTELSSNREELTIQIAELQEALDGKTREHENLDAELKSHVERALDLDGHRQEQQTRISALTTELEHVRTTKEELEERLTDTERHVKSLTETIVLLQGESERNKTQSSRLEQEAKVLRQSLNELRATLERNANERTELLRQLEHASDATKRTSILEKEKALLLDHLEGITGKPMGDIEDDVPPIPVGFHTPRSEASKKAIRCTPEEALRSITRIARLANPANDSRRRSCDKENDTRNEKHPKAVGIESANLAPNEVVMIVRELRTERNELRRRDRLWREENTKLKKKLKLADDVAKKSMDGDLHTLAERLDSLFGLNPPTHLSSIDRLRVSVDGAFLMREEMLSLQRQHNSVSLLLKQEERRSSEKEKEIKRLTATGQHDKEEFSKSQVCEETRNRTESEKESLVEDLKHYSAVSGVPSTDMIGSAALRYARSKEFEILKLEKRLTELEVECDKWKNLHEQRVRHTGPELLKNNLFKWKSAPLDLQRNYSVDFRSFTNNLLSKQRTLPPISQPSGTHLKLLPTKILEAESRSGSFDTRPVPAEIQVKMNRVQDQLLKDKSLGKVEKDEHREALTTLLSGDPRDAEISSLKIRLVRSEKERMETATRATNDRREAQIKLQQATRILEQAQTLTEQLKDVFLNININGNDGESVMQYAATMMDSFLARVEKLNIEG